MDGNPLQTKSYAFALRIIKLFQYLEKKKEFTMSKQVLRCGTAIGAMISEARFGESKADFASKMNIALKEANETYYWLCLLKDSGYIEENFYNSLTVDVNELIAMLVSTVKTAKSTKPS